MAKLLLAGYFGCGNLGDDAILTGFAGAIGTEHQLNVLAGSPPLIGRNYGMTATDRTDLNAIKNALDQADALVFPGGGIFQDVTSVRSVAYYANLVKLAKKAKKRVILLGQGVGPINTFLGKRFAAAAFRAADVVCVRDPGSSTSLTQIGVSRPVRVTADTAFLLPKPELMESSAHDFAVGDMRTIGVNCRVLQDKSGKNVAELFSKLVQGIYDRGYVPTMVTLDTKDQFMVDDISKRCNGKVPEIKGVNTPRGVQERIMRMEAMVAMRMHAGILATTSGVPSLMIDYDPKVRAFANQMAYPTPLKFEGLTAERLLGNFDSFMVDIVRSREAVERRRHELAKMAQGNIDALRACIG